MKNKKLLIAVLTCLVLAFSFCLSGCGSSSESSSGPEKHIIAVPGSMASASDDYGADAYDGWCDNPDSQYFKINDYYNMESDGTLHILSKFKTYEQSTEYSCGPSSAFMVLNWFQPKLAKKYNEEKIIEMSGTDENTGVGPDGIQKFFNDIGWYTQVNYQTDPYFTGKSTSGDALLEFEKFCIKNIDNGVPVMVDWIDWDGHWQVIIGIDTCQKDNSSDDVLILADPYDTSDQYQDGYYTFSAERFFYMWHEGACTDKTSDELAVTPFVIAMPQKTAAKLGYK